MRWLAPVRGFVSGLVLLVGLAPVAFAHHGWGWASDELDEMTGEIADVRLGNPHGEVDIVIDGETWTIEVGQPWRNERAGLSEELLESGSEITVLGNVSEREGERLVKAVRVTTAEGHHDLYPGRIPDSD
ncbi:hypothetical protein SAMN04488052_107124 [Aquisalimonas asiatica]|uniref:Uncharacterized protein n=2 Tax=Aquisalimonas asiatica TaxID=406100 RepID=A0A1H8UNQ7_9GAMM|nr:hypothetical protein SAMN04488052_107124 [Aquisalimonas asiatica]